MRSTSGASILVKQSTMARASGSEAAIRKGRLLPKRLPVRSERKPTSGFHRALIMLTAATSVPAAAGSTWATVVRNHSMYEPMKV